MKHNFRDIDPEYARRMRKAKYQAFWIRVRFWIVDHESSLAILAIIILVILSTWSIRSYK